MDNELRALVLVPSNDLYNEFLERVMDKETFMGIDAPGIIACVSVDGGLDTFYNWCKKVTGYEQIMTAPYLIGGMDFNITAGISCWDTDDGIPSSIKEPSGEALTVGNIVITKYVNYESASLDDEDIRVILSNISTYHSDDGESGNFRAVAVQFGNKHYEKN